MITAAIFDVANVIVDWDASRAFPDLSAEQIDEFVRSEAFQEINARTDAGMPLHEGLIEFDDRAPHLVDVYRTYLRNFPLTVSGPIPGTAEVIDELLARGVPTFGLSNWAKENFNIARRNGPVIDRLADIIVSGEVGLAKPDPEIFRHALDRFGLEAASTVMIDDTQANIDSAREVGMVTILFTDAAQLRADLVSIGLLLTSLFALTDTDVRRQAALSRMKLVALSLLVSAAIIYLATLRLPHDGVWGWVNSGAEAAMIGALADWFAVTALFRHPLGLPIPHTAIIPKRKDEIARNLQDFFTENFLTEEVARERLAATRVGTRLGQWLSDEAHARRVVAEGARLARIGLDHITDDDVATLANDVILPRLTKEPLAGVMGDLLDAVVVDGAHHGLVDLVVGEAHDWLRRHPEVFIDLVEQRAPRWTPGFVNHKVSRWTYDNVVEWLWEIRKDRAHPTRKALDDLLRQVADDLQHNPVVAERAEALKDRLLSHPQLAETIVSLWATVRTSVQNALGDEGSALRQRGERAVQRFGDSLLSDDELRASVEKRLSDLVAFFVISYGPELANVISHTIQRWDGKEAAKRIELHVGRDLQFIRINGTVIGCLAGLAIHAVSVLVG